MTIHSTPSTPSEGPEARRRWKARAGMRRSIHVLGSVGEAVDQTEHLLRNGQRRVALFPAGGVTFPIPPAPPPRRR